MPQQLLMQLSDHGQGCCCSCARSDKLTLDIFTLRSTPSLMLTKKPVSSRMLEPLPVVLSSAHANCLFAKIERSICYVKLQIFFSPVGTGGSKS